MVSWEEGSGGQPGANWMSNGLTSSTRGRLEWVGLTAGVTAKAEQDLDQQA